MVKVNSVKVGLVRNPPAEPGAQGSARRAFTLIEMTIALGLLTILVGVITANMFGRVADHYLDEGSQQFETVLRLTRAEAAGQGRRFRLSFDAETGDSKVQWEPQPLAQPGQFAAFADSSWVESLPTQYVRVVRCRKLGSDAYETLVFGQPKRDDMNQRGQANLDEVDFYPDGSSESAIIELASRDEKDPRRAVIQLDGVNHLITTQLMLEEEVAELYTSMGLETER